ncbi:hypothetical protein V8D89_003946 [Ganoderma adspersum]
MCRHLKHVEIRGFPWILTSTEPSTHLFQSTLQSVHFTGRDYRSNFHHCLDRALQPVSHLPSLETFVVENYILSSSQPNEDHGTQSEDDHNIIVPSVRTLKFVRCSDFDFQFVSEVLRSFPNLTTLHFDRTPFQRGSPEEYSIDHLVLTNIPDELDDYYHPGVPWKARRLTHIRDAERDHNTFSIPRRQADVSNVLCLTIKARVIAQCTWPGIWADLISVARAVRLLELESSLTTFSDLVGWLIERPLPARPVHVALTCISISTRELGYLWDSPPGNWERTRNEVLQAASKYFRSLRYVAIATPKRSACFAPPPPFPGDGVPVWTWWRVHRDGGGSPVEIREIPVWEGRRVREFLQNADADTVFDRACV